jgi:hypothetical protein
MLWYAFHCVPGDLAATLFLGEHKIQLKGLVIWLAIGGPAAYDAIAWKPNAVFIWPDPQICPIVEITRHFTPPFFSLPK